MLGGGLAAIACALLSRYSSFLPTEISSCVGTLCLVILIESTYPTLQIRAQKMFLFKRLAAVDVVSTATYLGYIFLFLPNNRNFSTLIEARASEAIVRFLMTLICTNGLECISISIKAAHIEYFVRKFGKYTFPQCIFEAATSTLDLLLLSLFSTTRDLGLYERFQQILRISLSLSINLVDKVALADFARNQTESFALSKSLARFLTFTLLTGLSLLFSMSLLFEPVLNLVFGSDWAKNLSPLWLAGCSLVLLRPIVWLLNIFFQGTSHPKALLHSIVFGTILTVLFGLPLTMKWGAEGLLAAISLASLLTLLFQFHLLREQSLQLRAAALTDLTQLWAKMLTKMRTLRTRP